MKEFLLIICLSNLLIASLAQTPCSEDAIMSTSGHWKKSADANPFPDNSFPRNQFGQANSRIDKMQKLLQAAYPEPKGIEAKWYRSISGDALVKGGPVPYELESLFLAYYCNTYENKIEAGGETSTWFYVWANQFNWFAQFINIITVHHLPVFLLNKKIGVLNGYPLYEGIRNGTSNTGTVYSRAIMITRPGQSPYLPVTQKQFLKAFINYNEKRNPKFIAAIEKNTTVLTDEEEEAYKNKQLQKIEQVTVPAKLAKAKENFLKNYVTSKQRKEASITQSKKFYEEELRPARTLLADSLTVDLEQAAIIDYDNVLEFKTFTTEEKGGQQLVRLNPDYFNLALPKYSPQLFIVYWSWDKGNPQINFKNEIEAKFNFNALKEMLDK